jgi:hypothetical protein
MRNSSIRADRNDVSLGDSLAQGYQPIGGGSPFCGYPGAQLAAAVAFLRAHRGEVTFVTIDIGGVDVLDPAGGGVAAVRANLPVILAELHEAAGSGVPIVGMSYYSSTLPSVWAETHDVQAVEARVGWLAAFNDLLESIYAAAGDRVADVESAFDSTDTALVDGVPADVVRLCEWTRLCRRRRSDRTFTRTTRATRQSPKRSNERFRRRMGPRIRNSSTRADRSRSIASR